MKVVSNIFSIIFCIMPLFIQIFVLESMLLSSSKSKKTAVGKKPKSNEILCYSINTLTLKKLVKDLITNNLKLFQAQINLNNNHDWIMTSKPIAFNTKPMNIYGVYTLKPCVKNDMSLKDCIALYPVGLSASDFSEKFYGIEFI